VGDHHGQETGLNVTSTPAGKSGPWLRTVAVPEVLEEARRNGVQTKKNRNKSSICDNYVTCVDVRCFY